MTSTLTGVSLSTVKLCGTSGRKEAAVAGAQVASLAADFRAGFTFQQVADLLDAGMGVRHRAFSLLDDTENDLDLPRADGVGADQAMVGRAGVIGGMISGDFSCFHEITASLVPGQCVPPRVSI